MQILMKIIIEVIGHRPEATGTVVGDGGTDGDTEENCKFYSKGEL
jgi:hypothetical protein